MLLKCYLFVLLIVAYIYGCISKKCQDTASTGSGKWYCCDNHEWNEKNGTCDRCPVGYISDVGEPCHQCLQGFYGNKCLIKCHCRDTQREKQTIQVELVCYSCHHVEGCKDAETTVRLKTETPAPAKECGLAKTDLVIILDASTSVGQSNFEKMLQFCKDFLANADIDSGNVQAGILTYSTDVKVEFQIGAYKTTTDLEKAIDGIKYALGSTNTADAILTMATKMFGTSADRSDAPNIAIVVTDGVSNINSRRTIPEAESARKNNIHIYSIGIGLTDTKEVFAIATPPHEENSFYVNSFDELRGLDQNIFSSICPEFVTTNDKFHQVNYATSSSLPSVSSDEEDSFLGLSKKEIVVYSVGIGGFTCLALIVLCLGVYTRHIHRNRPGLLGSEKIRNEVPVRVASFGPTEEIYETIDESKMIHVSLEVTESITVINTAKEESTDSEHSHSMTNNEYLNPYQPMVPDPKKHEYSVAADMCPDDSGYLNPYQPMVPDPETHEYSVAADMCPDDSGYLNPYQQIIPDSEPHNYLSIQAELHCLGSSTSESKMIDVLLTVSEPITVDTTSIMESAVKINEEAMALQNQDSHSCSKVISLNSETELYMECSEIPVDNIEDRLPIEDISVDIVPSGEASNAAEK